MKTNKPSNRKTKCIVLPLPDACTLVTPLLGWMIRGISPKDTIALQQCHIKESLVLFHTFNLQKFGNFE